jgi:Terpene cyclase DEP1
MKPKHAYLLLCIFGAVLPYSQFVPWIAQHGLNLPLLLRELFANRIGAFFGMDVIVSAVALLTFIRVERKRALVPGWGFAVLGTLLIGVSFGLPFFLYLRESAAGQSYSARA